MGSIFWEALGVKERGAESFSRLWAIVLEA